MSASRKFLKIVSMLVVLTSIGFLVCGVLMAGFGLFSAAPISGTDAAMPYAGVSAVTCAVFLLMGLSGMQSANVPSKINTTCAMVYGGIALMAVNVAFWAWQGFSNIDGADAVLLVLGIAEVAAAFVFARNVKKEREVWH